MKPKREVEQDEDDESRRFHRAYKLLRAAANEAKSPSKYLKSRGIEIVPECAMLLSANGAAKYKLPRFPAMVVPVVNSERLLGAHVTPLIRDMTKRIKGKKRSFGPIKGGYVILAPVDPDRPLIVGEGIESALSAMQATGLPGIATLGTSNMKSLNPPKCSEIIIAADNDEPGLIAAEALAQRLAARRVVRIAVPERIDWNEELCKTTDLKEMRRAILKAEQFEGEEAEVRALTMEEVIAMAVPPREHLLGPWLDTGSLAMTHAPRGDGKTLLMMSVAYAVASGQPLLDWECERPVRVLYVDGELPTTVLQERLKSLGPITPNLMVLSRDIMLRQNEMTLPDLGEPAGRKFLDKIIERERIDFVILDSLSTLIRSGIENDAESWAPIQDWLLNHRFANRTIMLVHHEGRSGHARGTSKREDALDTIVKLKGRDDLRHDER
jgi:putative DNA primase/helicase